MPYRWWQLPDPISANWMAYSHMLGEYASELANIINRLTQDVKRLHAWAVVTAPLSNEQKVAASYEFVDTLGTVALGQPYAIKSRFGFAAAHLCHQANKTKLRERWLDELPDERALYLNDIEPICANWPKYRAFKRRVEPIAGAAFKEATADFRNAYNHRFSGRFLIGMSGMVKRIVGGDGRICYGFGGDEPLDLNRVAGLLAQERDLCGHAFEAFQALVEEQCLAITEYEQQNQGANT